MSYSRMVCCADPVDAFCGIHFKLSEGEDECLS